MVPESGTYLASVQVTLWRDLSLSPGGHRRGSHEQIIVSCTEVPAAALAALYFQAVRAAAAVIIGTAVWAVS
jgi:hypothetical protein